MLLFNMANSYKQGFESLYYYSKVYQLLLNNYLNVNYIGQVTGVSTGTTQIIGTYKYNFRCSYNNNSKC